MIFIRHQLSFPTLDVRVWDVWDLNFTYTFSKLIQNATEISWNDM